MVSNRAHFVAFSQSSDKMVRQTWASSAGHGGNTQEIKKGQSGPDIQWRNNIRIWAFLN